MALAHLVVDLDRMDGDAVLGRTGQITFDPLVDVVDTAAGKVHVGVVTVAIDANGEGSTDLVAGVAYRVRSTLLRAASTIGPLDADTTVNLADVITPGAPPTPSQYASLDARLDALESTPPGSAADATTSSKGIVKLAGDLGGTADAPTVPGLAGKAPTTHTHTASQVSDSTATGRAVLTAASQAAARTAIGAGTSSFDGAYGSLTGTPSTFAPAAHKTSHATGGGDALTPSDIGAAASSHTHTASQVSDFTEATQDVVGALVTAAGGTYDDTAGTITLPSGGGGSGVDAGSFPIEGYGFVAATLRPEEVDFFGAIANLFVARAWVPAGKAITGAKAYVKANGTTGSGEMCFAVWEDDLTLAGRSATNTGLLNVANDTWVSDTLSATIALQGAGRFVYVGLMAVGAGTVQGAFKAGEASSTGVKHIAGTYRCGYSASATSVPSPLVLGSLTETGYIPLLALT